MVKKNTVVMSKFTIQNVSIKFDTEYQDINGLDNLQYKMFLLNFDTEGLFDVTI